MNTKDTTEPTLQQYQAYNGEWCDFLDEQHYLDTVADGKCRVRHLYAAPQPVTAPAWVMLTSDEIETLALQEKFWTSSDTPNVFAWSEFAEAVQINMVAKQGGDSMSAANITALLTEIDRLRAGDAMYQWLLKNGLFAQPHGSDTQIGIHGAGPVGILFVNDIFTDCPTTAIRAAIVEQEGAL